MTEPSFFTSLQSRLRPLHPWIQMLLRLTLGGLFIWSGIAKLQHAADFQLALLNYGMIDGVLAQMLAKAIPPFEILVGVYLVLGLFTHWTSLVSGLMTLGFTFAVGWVLFQGKTIDCGCYLAGRSEPVTPIKIVENLAMIIGLAYLYGARPSQWSVDHHLKP